MERYDHTKIEKKWQQRWEESGAFVADDSSTKEKEYLLIEFPYPSGDGLHVGHVRSYTAMDVLARKHRAEGKNVLYPIGWDAFGLPAENYAIKTGVHPKITTKQNTENFKRQIKALGISFDWSREIDTTDPAYYKWTQWIFLQLFKKGLAYKTNTLINWCPKDKVTLANEEVVDGACERCGTPVEKREKEQWMLAITKYAQRLYDDLDTVDYIPAAKAGQRNWIAPSQGAEIEFAVARSSKKIKVFTTRADTLFGATYMVLAPEHPLIGELAPENKTEIEAYAKAAKAKNEIERSAEGKEKTGVELKGIKAINPANGEEIPMYVADYVLGHYGTGAIMAVPAHDERDGEFAKKYNIPVKEVVVEQVSPRQPDSQFRRIAVSIVENDKGEILMLSQDRGEGETYSLPGGGVDEGESIHDAALRETQEETGFYDFKTAVEVGTVEANYLHQVRKIYRQALATCFYIPLASDARKEPQFTEYEKQTVTKSFWVSKEKALELLEGGHGNSGEDTALYKRFLQGLIGSPFTNDGILIHSGKFDGLTSEEAKQKITEFVGGRTVTTFKLRDWVFGRQRYWGEPIPLVHCEKDGWVAVPESELPVLLPETDTFLPGKEGESPLANMDEWVNTTCPTCKGPAKRETDVMPQWAGSSWYYLRYADPHNANAFASAEKLKHWTPVDWYNGGMEHTTLHLLYSRFWHKFLFDEGLVPSSESYMKRTSHGLIMAEDGSKMSKSKGNTVSPDVLVEQFGADSLRMYEMFIGPFDQPVAWNTNSVVGVRRFLERVWKLVEKVEDVSMDEQTETLLHQTIDKVSKDIDTLKMNTAVSALMILVNHLGNLDTVPQGAYVPLLQLLTPLAPHITHELAEHLSLECAQWEVWPVANASKVVATTVTIAVQVNGKMRGSIELAVNVGEEEALATARQNPAVAGWLAKGAEKKAIYVPNEIINFVVS